MTTEITKWFPTGILDIKPFQLTDAQKQQLLKVIGKSEEEAGAFLNEIEKPSRYTMPGSVLTLLIL